MCKTFTLYAQVRVRDVRYPAGDHSRGGIFDGANDDDYILILPAHTL